MRTEIKSIQICRENKFLFKEKKFEKESLMRKKMRKNLKMANLGSFKMLKIKYQAKRVFLSSPIQQYEPLLTK